MHQHFLANPLMPENGVIKAPTAVGINMDLDAEKIESEEEFMPA